MPSGPGSRPQKNFLQRLMVAASLFPPSGVSRCDRRGLATGGLNNVIISVGHSKLWLRRIVVSKPAFSKALFPALWISAVLIAAAGLVAAGPAGSGRPVSNPAPAVAVKPRTPESTPGHARLNAAYAALPLGFEANQGQA